MSGARDNSAIRGLDVEKRTFRGGIPRCHKYVTKVIQKANAWGLEAQLCGQGGRPNPMLWRIICLS